MNMIDIQDKLKNLSEDQLIKEMQAPSGQAPQFLVLSEITRRKKMRDSFKAQEAKQGMPTVAEEVVASAAVPQQGLPQMASAMAPKSSIAQNTGIGALPVQGMYAGGPVKKMAQGGKIVVRNGVRYVQQPDGTFVTETQARTLTPMQDIQNFGQMLADLPATAGATLADYSAGIAGDMNASLAATGDAAMRRQMAEDVYGMRAGPSTAYQYPGIPAVDTAPMDRAALAEAAMLNRAGPMTGRSVLPPTTMYRDALPVDLDLTQGAEDISTYLNNLPARDALQSRMMGLEPASTLATPMTDAAVRPEFVGALPAAPVPPAPVAPGPSFEQVGREIGAASPSDMAAVAAMRNEIADPNAPGFMDAISGLASSAWDRITNAAPMVRMQDPGSPRADRDQQGFDNLEEEDATGLPPDAPQGGAEPPIQVPSAVVAGAGTGGGGGGSGGASATPGKGGYISELEAALQRAERIKEQDKWLALAQAGLALMASDQPTLGGAIGEAGQVGIEAFRGARDEYEQSRMSIMEAIAAQKAAAAKAAGGGGRGGGGGAAGIDAVLKSLNSDLEGIMTEATTYDDQGNEVTTYVPLQGYEDTAAQLSAMRDQLLRQRYGLGAFDATQ